MADEVNIKLSLCANNTYGLYETIHSLNNIIDALWTLSDTDYYLSHVFNGGTNSDEIIQHIFNKDDIVELADKFEHIRAIVLSELLDQGADNFREFEYAILQSVWEQKFSANDNRKNIDYDKRKAKSSYNSFMKLTSEIKKYYKTRYGEEIEGE